jgi:hypothetical protein
MIQVPSSPRYGQNFQGVSHGDGPCCVCGKGIQVGRTFLHLHYGGGTAILESEFAEAERASSGDLGLQPIGADCLARHPELQPYVQRP